MKRLWHCRLVFAAAAAHAHTNSGAANRGVAGGEGSVVVLVQGPFLRRIRRCVFGRASWGRSSDDARRALEASLAAKAIGPLTLTLDGKKLERKRA